MRVPDEVKQCLGFLVTKDKVNKRRVENYEGTAFFVLVPSEMFPTQGYFYLVAAKHVVVDKKGEILPSLYLRLNTLDGKSDDISLSGDWVFSKNKDIDVAVMSIVPPDDHYFQCKSLPYDPTDTHDDERNNIFADEKVIKEWGVGVGDDLCVVGLFSEHTGKQRNIPIVRRGSIAAMPEEPIDIEVDGTRKVFNAYLIEARSIGGLSGSPVFTLLEHFRRPKKDKEEYRLLVGVGFRLFLLGMVRGHWDYRTQYTLRGITDKDLEHVNMGIAYITPVQDILSVLYGDELIAQRKKDDQEALQQSKAVASEDSARKTTNTPDKGITQEGFQDALKRASQKTSQPESETNEK